jgi:hypothetical protein
METSTQKESQMNRYGALAQNHYKTFLPHQYAQIENPTEFFTSLGDQMADQISELKLSLAGDDPGGETFLEKVGRLNAAEQRAREQVLAETLPVPADNDELSNVTAA